MFRAEQKQKFKINFRPLAVAFLSLLLGIICARRLYAGDGVYIALVVILFASLIVYCCIKIKWLALVIIASAFALGNGLYFLSYWLFTGKEYYDASISGRVCAVEYDADSSRSTLILEDVVANGDSVGNTSLTIYATQEGDFQLGDILVYNGDLTHRNLFTLGSFKSGDYRDGVAYNSSVSKQDVALTSGGLKFDEKAREKIAQVLYSNMDEKYAGIAYAVLVGEKGGIDEDVYNAFASSGIIHILTVSGLHVAFITTLIAWVMKKCKVNRFVNFVLTFVILLVYAYICGFAPSVIRAMIMGLMLVSASLFGRRYDGANALSVAGILTLLIAPLSALDVGFLMSYGCVAAIFVLQKPIANVLGKVIPKRVADLLAISLATQVGILPFLASFFSELNLLSFFANLIVVPFFGVVFMLLIVLVIAVLIIPSLGGVLMLCQWGFVAIEAVANFFASTSFKIYLTPLDPLISAMIFLAAFACSYFLFATNFAKWFIVAAICLVMACYSMLRVNFSPTGTNASLITSGYSNTLVLQSKSGQILCLNYDDYLVKYYLSQQNLDHVDYVLGIESGNGSEFGGQVVVDENGFVGDFKFSVEDDIYIIEFDDVKILFTNLSNSRYNVLAIEQKLNSQNFDFVFAKNYQPTQQINGFFASSSASEYCDYAIDDLGSFSYSFNSGDVRRID